MKIVILLLLVSLCGCMPDYAGHYLRNNPDAPPDIVACIQKKQIKTGMTKEQVKASWGPRNGGSDTHYEGLDIDTWTYQSAWDRYGYNTTYVYFTNGRVSGWSD